VGAANRLVSIAHLYAEHFDMNRCPVFFTYYVFTASIMHVTILLDNSDDIQASSYLRQAMEILESMAIVWPSAGRAFELLVGAEQNIDGTDHKADTSSGHVHGHYEVSRQHAMSKRRADDEPEQLQYRSQLDQPRETSVQSAFIERQLQLSELDGSQIHAQREGVILGKTLISTPPHQDHLAQPEVFEGQASQRADSSNTHPVRVNVGSWGGATPLMTVPTYSAHVTDMFVDYDASRLPGPRYTPYPDASQQTQPITDNSASYSVAVSGRYERRASPRPHQEQYNFQTQSAPSAQHSQNFWNEYSGSGGDLFADPSSLSASLYTLPLLGPVQQTQHRDQALMGQHALNHGSSTDPYTGRQTYLPPSRSYPYDA